jgi:phage shock protein C
MNEPYQNSSPTGSPQPPYRLLRRSRSDRMVAGVCAGLAHYLRVDPTLVRVGFAVLAIITWGVALLAYLIAWIVMPEAAE